MTLSLSQSGKIDCGAPCYGLPSKGHGEVSLPAYISWAPKSLQRLSNWSRCIQIRNSLAALLMISVTCSCATVARHAG